LSCIVKHFFLLTTVQQQLTKEAILKYRYHTIISHWSQKVEYRRLSEFVQLVSCFTRRMAIANGTCVSFCNQPKAHYLATSRKSRRYVVRRVAFGYVKRAQGTFWPPWVRPWDNRGKCYMDRPVRTTSTRGATLAVCS